MKTSLLSNGQKNKNKKDSPRRVTGSLSSFFLSTLYNMHDEKKEKKINSNNLSQVSVQMQHVVEKTELVMQRIVWHPCDWPSWHERRGLTKKNSQFTCLLACFHLTLPFVWSWEEKKLIIIHNIHSIMTTILSSRFMRVTLTLHPDLLVSVFFFFWSKMTWMFYIKIKSQWKIEINTWN